MRKGNNLSNRLNSKTFLNIYTRKHDMSYWLTNAGLRQKDATCNWSPKFTQLHCWLRQQVYQLLFQICHEFLVSEEYHIVERSADRKQQHFQHNVVQELWIFGSCLSYHLKPIPPDACRESVVKHIFSVRLKAWLIFKFSYFSCDFKIISECFQFCLSI